MTFTSEDPIYLNRTLCSVEIFAPSQIDHPAEAFGLMASAWFGTTREDIPTANGIVPLTIGLHSATLIVDCCDNSNMQRDGRYRSDPLTFKYESQSDENAHKSHEVSGGGSASIPFLNFFNANAAGKGSTKKDREDNTKRQQDSTFDVYEVESNSRNGWTIQAINRARPEPHLKGAELSDVVLCQIETPKGVASVRASLVVTSSDLWVNDDAGSRGTSSLEDQANQNAVLTALVSKAADQNRADDFTPDPDENTLVVAQSTLHRKKPEVDT